MPGWVVYDKKTNRPYIRRFLDTREEAEAVREDLLRPYDNWDPWRRRIGVHYWRERMPGTRRKKRENETDSSESSTMTS